MAVRDGNPKRVAKLLRGEHESFQVYVARAHTRAALTADDLATRNEHFEDAVKIYRKILSLRDDRSWFRGDVRRTEVVGWYVEMGDVLLRHLIAPGLDQYEITSGLTYDEQKLVKLLTEAHAAYVEAGVLLDDLIINLHTDEERFLLLGIADQVTTLNQQCRLNGAWAATYLAMIGGEKVSTRDRLLAEALNAFDTLSRRAREPDLKYNALIGAGVSLREAGRYAEADSAFNRVKDSMASISLVARAMYENARNLLKLKRFREARAELDALAAVKIDVDDADASGAEFYIRLAPLIKAWAYFVEADTLPPLSKTQQQDLLSKGHEMLNAVAAQGGIWPDIVRVYDSAIDYGESPDGRPTLAQLRKRSRQAMSDQNYAEGVKVFVALLEHEGASSAMRQQAWFNLGVCHFQLGHLRKAAEAFSEAAKTGSGEDARRAADYAYRCWRQLALDTKSREDYLLLAHAAELLVDHLSPSPEREEIEWISALARQEAGDYARAQTAYSRITRTAKQYWQARRNMARCRQSAFDELPDIASSSRRRRAARAAIEGWTDLADKLLEAMAAKDAADQLKGLHGAEEANEWIRDAALSAATLMADDLIQRYADSLKLLETLKPTPRVLALRIRCYRGMGDVEAAERALRAFLSDASGPELGSTLAGLAADMENEAQALRKLGRMEDARRVAADMAATLRQLLAWTLEQPDSEKHIAIIRFSLAKALRLSGKYSDAMKVLNGLMESDPQDGSYVREAALTQEEVAGLAKSGNVEADQAEALWERLLRDKSLREAAPDVYWEARYYWLTHQLRHGKAAEVAKAIETERAWYPDLGGTPWQAKLLELAASARQQAPSTSAPATKS